MNGFEGLALANKDYVAETYRRWKADPSSVDSSWAGFFAGLELASENGGAAVAAPVAAAGNGKHLSVVHATRDELPAPRLGVYDLVHSYRELGHLIADVNPLEPPPATHPLLAPPQFGFS